MIVIFILIGFSLIVALIFLLLYIWSVKDGQYDDDYTPSVRILFDENNLPKKEKNNKDENTDTINNDSETKLN
jgi:cbb3-type cytochrome oxidase maturation protein